MVWPFSSSAAPAKEEPKAETTVETKTETTPHAPASAATSAETLSAIAANENAIKEVEQKKVEAVKTEPAPAATWSFLSPSTWFGSNAPAPEAPKAEVKVEPAPEAVKEEVKSEITALLTEVTPVTQEVTKAEEAKPEPIPTKLEKINFVEQVTANTGKKAIETLANKMVQQQIDNNESKPITKTAAKKLLQARKDELIKAEASNAR
jgi:hypothetical protein